MFNKWLIVKYEEGFAVMNIIYLREPLSKRKILNMNNT